ncbi:hypothetical protein PGTUg99_016004 [Puccinia graminis f. sp. tritici]|uniref:Uncharacterized protein n=1 Tax=Puccinia graminis f. sp. tritici TaxID=56615 RepID=A0A5B0RIF2_PUCGR|nr:hypothetical protein PGTUg99_016004 [Puccinia graminis f. sp. tritici]
MISSKDSGTIPFCPSSVCQQQPSPRICLSKSILKLHFLYHPSSSSSSFPLADSCFPPPIVLIQDLFRRDVGCCFLGLGKQIPCHQPIALASTRHTRPPRMCDNPSDQPRVSGWSNQINGPPGPWNC